MSKQQMAVDLYKAGVPRTEIARQLGMRYTSVIDALICRGILKRGSGKRGPKPTYDYGEFRRLYDAGHSDTEIARQIGAHLHTVRSWRRSHRLPVNNLPASVHPLAADIADLRSKGLSYSAVGARLGITRNAVAGIINRSA